MLPVLKDIQELNESSLLFDLLYICFKCLIQSTVGSTQGKIFLYVSEKIKGAALLMYLKLCNCCIIPTALKDYFLRVIYFLFKVNRQINFNLVINIHAVTFYCIFLSKLLRSYSTILHANNVNLIN